MSIRLAHWVYLRYYTFFSCTKISLFQFKSHSYNTYWPIWCIIFKSPRLPNPISIKQIIQACIYFTNKFNIQPIFHTLLIIITKFDQHSLISKNWNNNTIIKLLNNKFQYHKHLLQLYHLHHKFKNNSHCNSLLAFLTSK